MATDKSVAQAHLAEGILKLDIWWKTPAGQMTIDWEQAQLDLLVADRFGFHAMQLGSPAIDGLRSNRMPHRWLVGVASTETMVVKGEGSHRSTQVWVDDDALPFGGDTMDLMLLPHTLEYSSDPHGCVREAYRALRAEGVLVITGFNEWSWWGLSQWVRRRLAKLGLQKWGVGRMFLPAEGDFLNASRVKDWLRLMGMEIQEVRHGLYLPAIQDPKWIHRWQPLEKWGHRWWRIFGAGFVIVAIKKVPAVRLMSKRTRRLATMPSNARAATTMGATPAERSYTHGL